MQTGTGYFLSASLFGKKLVNAPISRMLIRFQNGAGGGVANACALNSICHESRSPAGRQIREFENAAPGFGVHAQTRKRISLAWNCCGIGC